MYFHYHLNLDLDFFLFYNLELHMSEFLHASFVSYFLFSLFLGSFAMSKVNEYYLKTVDMTRILVLTRKNKVSNLKANAANYCVILCWYCDFLVCTCLVRRLNTWVSFIVSESNDVFIRRPKKLEG